MSGPERYDRALDDILSSARRDHTERRRGDRAEFAQRRDRAGQAQRPTVSTPTISSACGARLHGLGFVKAHTGRAEIWEPIGNALRRLGLPNSPPASTRRAVWSRPSPPHNCGTAIVPAARSPSSTAARKAAFNERHLLMASCLPFVAAELMAPSLLPRRSAAIVACDAARVGRARSGAPDRGRYTMSRYWRRCGGVGWSRVSGL